MRATDSETQSQCSEPGSHSTWGDKVTVSFKENACKEAYKYHGYFALVSNKERDCFRSLEKYRKCDTVEDYFQAEKQQADGSRVRVWTPDALRGRMFVQFVELCYYEYFAEKLRQLKKSLRTQESDDSLRSEEINLIRKLRSWIENTPQYLQLQWFDTVEEVKISSELHNKRWNTEVTARDQLYLDHLGVDLE